MPDLPKRARRWSRFSVPLDFPSLVPLVGVFDVGSGAFSLANFADFADLSGLSGLLSS